MEFDNSRISYDFLTRQTSIGQAKATNGEDEGSSEGEAIHITLKGRK